ncbi:MAG TPA: hypothetical protein VL990_09375 [Acidobacteriaceae bacterium]|nr:hypothetical protein [Acidobacteriaceae bacterium]
MPGLIGTPPTVDTSLRSQPPRDSALPEIFFAAVILPLVAIAIAEAHRSFLVSPGTDWNSSEWMIDYSAGFMRRGLGGTLLLHLLHATGWSFFAVLTSLTTAAFLALCGIAGWMSRRTRAPALWRLALLLNPLLLVAAAEYGSFARKDILVLWGTVVNVAASHWILQRNPSGSRQRLRLALLALAVVLVLSVFLAGLHEGLFLFAWLPVNAAVAAYVLRRLYPNRNAGLAALALAFTPGLAIIVASVLHHGGPGAAQTICRSWRFAFPVNCTPGPQFPKAIDALAWSMRRDVVGCLSFVWTAGHYYLFIFALLAVLAVALLLVAMLVLAPAARLEHLLTTTAVSFLFAIPLFILGTDWGRWLFLAATSSLIVMLSEPLRPAPYSLLPAPLQRRVDRASRSAGARLAILRRIVERHPGFSLTLLLMLPLPPLPIASAMLLSNPLMIFLNFLGRLHGS